MPQCGPPGIGGRAIGSPVRSRVRRRNHECACTLAARLARLALAAGLALSDRCSPRPCRSAAADDKVLRIGTLQDLDSINPYGTILGVGYEAFELSFDQLVGFGPNVEPIPAYATSWERNPDGKSWTFKFRPDLKWSDGTPATSADACFSWQLAVDAQKDGSYIGAGYLDYCAGQGWGPGHQGRVPGCRRR